MLLRNNGSDTPIYTAPIVALDNTRKPWVYWGTGDKTKPGATTTQDYFYAVKDDQDIGTVKLAADIPAPGSSGSAAGWRFQLDSGEKVLSESLVFNKVLYFATYIAPTTTNLCGAVGKARLYGVDYLTGAGRLRNGVQSVEIGDGIPSDVGVTFGKGKRKGRIIVNTSHASAIWDDEEVDNPFGDTKTLYWKDRKIE
jgi:Tfp pilus tip-associated adhesin PilY1